MRLRHALAAGLTAATTAAPVVLSAGAAIVPASPAYAADAVHVTASASPSGSASVSGSASASGSGAGSEAGRPPSCGKESDPDFPLKARIHGGPTAYLAGGGAGTWYLELTNTARTVCREIHPVVVLTDRDRSLTTSQLRLELADARGRWRSLSLEHTDEDEIIGVRDDGSPGYAVPAHGKITVRARLTFAAAARPNSIAMNAATVQRRGGDGDWVGESNAYRFAVRGAEGETESDRGEVGSGEVGSGDADRGEVGAHARGDSRTDGGFVGGTESPGHLPRPVRSPAPGRSPASDPDRTSLPKRTPASPPASARPTGPGTKPGGTPSVSASATPSASASASASGDSELASTGPGDLLELTAAVAALLAAGVGLVAVFRRLRP